MVGHPGFFRIRVGDYRIIYSLEDERLIITIVKIGHRSNIYEPLRAGQHCGVRKDCSDFYGIRSRPNLYAHESATSTLAAGRIRFHRGNHVNSHKMMIYSTYMKTPAPTLSPLLRSNAQGDLLAVLFLNPEDEFSLSDLARRVGALPATVHREIQRLVDSGILSDRMVGRSRLVRVNARHSLHAPLRELLLLTYGPKVYLEAVVADLPDVEQAYIYGSWAARYGGESGPAPRDIDVLVVGSTPRDALNSMAREAELALHREVNVTRVSPEEWQQAETPLVATLKSRPLVAIEQRTNDA